MKRTIDDILLLWKTSQARKPLILRGARQTGKTFAVRKFGKTFSSFVELNFEKTPELCAIFDSDLNPRRIIRDLSLLNSSRIEPGITLLFFDEIQNCPRAITALRYFFEEIPELHVVSAGSLLEFALGTYSVPVGRVQYLYTRPFTFLEFLGALGQELLVTAISQNESFTPFSEPVHTKIIDYVRQYSIIGGMPGVIARFLEQNSYDTVREEQESILQTYTDDFLKYSGRTDLMTIRSVFRTLPGMIGRETTYSEIAIDVTPYKVKQALEILEKSMVIYKVRCSSGAGLPLGAGASEKQYKSIFLDVGLMQCAAGMPLDAWLHTKNILDVYKGSIAEQFVGQEIVGANHHDTGQLYYWHRKKTGSQAEIDYLIQHGTHILPVEVKSGAAGRLKSMQQFFIAYPDCPLGIKISQANFSKTERLISIPLYATSLLFSKTTVLP